MADKTEIEIGQQIRRINGNTGKRFPVMSGVVTAVDTGDNTCSVELTCGDDTAPAEGVLLNVILGNTAGIYGVPAIGANCLVAEVDGPGQWELIKAEQYDTVYIGGGTLLQLNDGSLGGLPILQKIEDNQKAIRDYIKNILEPAIQTGITDVGIGGAANGGTGAAAFETAVTGQDITFEDMENKNITQGK